MEFPSTKWTQLAKATLHGDTASGTALAEFCRNYRRPVMSYLRWRGVPQARVEDLTHDFLMNLLEHSALARVDRSKGRFRTFLCTSLIKFIANDARYTGAQKRGGGIPHVSLENCGSDEEPAQLPANEVMFLDREWALNVMERAVEDIGREWDGSGKAGRFSALRPFLPGATLPADYEEAARLTGLTEGHVRTEVSRLRKRFREIVRSQVASTVLSPFDVDDELAHLGRVLTAAANLPPD